MKLTSKQSGSIQIVSVEDPRIDAAVAIQFKDAMRSETAKGASRIILDLQKVDFIDSSGLGAIVAALKQLDDDQSLDLAALSPAVDKVFRLTRMDTIFGIFPNVDAALLAKDAG